MLNVFNKIKNGNTVTYECRDENGNVSQLDKNSLITEIRAGNVDNARIQDYKGQLIIRLKDNVSSQSNKTAQSTSNTSTKSSTKPRRIILMLDLYKKIMKDFGIQNEEEALAFGFDNYDLDEELNTKYKSYYTKICYKMASDIRRLADKENNETLKRYREDYLKENEIFR